MYPKRVDIFDKADGYHVAFTVTDHFQLQLFPAQDGFLHQDLAYQAGLKASGADCFQLFLIIYQAASRAAHSVGGTEHYRVA